MEEKNPWLALRTYEEKDERKFFGRDKDIEDLFAMLSQNESVVCYAASGEGKSSLINAGLCPMLRRNDMFPVKITFTSEEYNNPIDFDSIIDVKITQAFREYENAIKETKELNIVWDDEFRFVPIDQTIPTNDYGSLWWKLRTQKIKSPFDGALLTPVIIFDQFEEIFKASWKAEFFKWLAALSNDICPNDISNIFEIQPDNLPSSKQFKLLFSMRYEYVGELDYWCSQKYFIPQMMRNRYFLKPLTNNQARTIIYEHKRENDKASKKLADSANDIIECISNSLHPAIGDEVPAFMLSLVCYVLYEQWAMSLAFSMDDLDIGNLIYEYYFQELAKLNMPEEDRNELESVLISSEGKRLRMPILDERLQKIGIEKYLSGTPNLVTTNLFKTDNAKNPQYVEIIHDKLADAIFEERKQSQKTFEKESRSSKITSLVFYFFLLLLFSVFGFLLFLSVKPEKEDDSDEEKTEKKALVIDLNKDLNHVYYFNDFVHATSLRTKQWLKFRDPKSYHATCYKNVLNLYNRRLLYDNSVMTFYAHNAKNIGFFHYIPDTLHFGPNTKKVYLFNSYYLSKIKSISCENRNTTILIPYRQRKKCMDNHAFDDVYFEELGWLPSAFQDLQDELLNGHSLVLGFNVSHLWFIILILIFYLVLLWFNVSNWGGMLVFAFTTLLLFIISVQLDLLYDIGTWWIPLIGIVGIIMLIYFIDDKLSKSDVPVAKYCILFNSIETKGWAILIRNALVENGISKDDIILDFSILKHGKIDYKYASACSESSKHVIALMTEKDMEKSEQNSDFHWVISRRNVHPIIIGLESFEQIIIPKKLRSILTSREIGTTMAFRSLFINSKEAIPSVITKLNASLSQKRTKACRHYNWCIIGGPAISNVCEFLILFLSVELDVSPSICLIPALLCIVGIIVAIFYYPRDINFMFKKRKNRQQRVEVDK